MKKIIPTLLAVMLILSACGSSEPETEPSVVPVPPEVAEQTPSSTTESEPEATAEPIRNPLSGEPIDEDISSKRPYVVMFNNISVALPHCGVSNTDILYEVLAEGDITRMVGVFSDISSAEKIGSIRSSRPYYIEIALSYDAIYVHAGGSEQAYSDISSKGVDNIDGVRGAYGGQIFYRDPNRQQYGIEHSLFTSADKILEYTPILGYEQEHSGSFDYGLTFAETPEIENGEPANNVNVSFSGLKNTDFTYNSDDKYYTAKEYGNDYIDGSTGEAVSFKNIIVLFAETSIYDDYGRRTVDLKGTGNGYFICNGKKVNINWHHKGTNEPFTYTLEDGTPFDLGVGRTYVGIVPTGSTITVS